MIPEQHQLILEELKKDLLKNSSLLNFHEQNPITDLVKIGENIILRGVSDQNWVYISSPNEQALLEAVEQLNESDKCFAAIEDWMVPMITRQKEIKWKFPLIKVYLPDHVCLEPSKGINIKPLNDEDARHIFENSIYQEVTSESYILERIQKGISCGITIDDELVAWAITHDDSAIGMLHVMESHRQKGFAYEVVSFMISQLRNQGKIPFACIEETNFKSLNLVKKFGFVVDQKINWFEIL